MKKYIVAAALAVVFGASAFVTSSAQAAWICTRDGVTGLCSANGTFTPQSASLSTGQVGSGGVTGSNLNITQTSDAVQRIGNINNSRIFNRQRMDALRRFVITNNLPEGFDAVALGYKTNAEAMAALKEARTMFLARIGFFNQTLMANRGISPAIADSVYQRLGFANGPAVTNAYHAFVGRLFGDMNGDAGASDTDFLFFSARDRYDFYHGQGN